MQDSQRIHASLVLGMVLVDQGPQIGCELHQALVDQLTHFLDESPLILYVDQVKIFGVFKEPDKRSPMVQVLLPHRRDMLFRIRLNRNQVLLPELRVIVEIEDEVFILRR